MTITQDGTVLDAVDISGSVTIKANNVTIRRSRVTSTTNQNNGIKIESTARNFVFEDSELEAGPANVLIGSGNYTLRRAIVHGGADALRLGSNTYIYDSYIYDLKRKTGSHNDTSQIISGSNVVISHSVPLAYKGVAGTGVKSGDPMNAILQIGNMTGNVSNVVFDNNIVNGGNYSFNANWTNVDAGTKSVSNIVISNNRIGRDFRYGPKSNISHGVVWKGNLYDDTGEVIN